MRDLLIRRFSSLFFSQKGQIPGRNDCYIFYRDFFLALAAMRCSRC